MSKRLLRKYGGEEEQLNYKYVIEKIDVDGDGVPDGVLIKRYLINNNNRKRFINQKFVLNDKITDAFDQYNIHNKNIVKSHNYLNEEQEQEQTDDFNMNRKKNNGVKIASQKEIERIENGGQIPPTQRVIMQDDTSMTQYMKQGFGMGLGWAAADVVGDVIGGFFE